MDGNLLESYVRSQKSIALLSGEVKYVCMVGGVSEALSFNTVGNLSQESCAAVDAEVILQQPAYWQTELALGGFDIWQRIFYGFRSRSTTRSLK